MKLACFYPCLIVSGTPDPDMFGCCVTSTIRSKDPSDWDVTISLVFTQTSQQSQKGEGEWTLDSLRNRDTGLLGLQLNS